MGVVLACLLPILSTATAQAASQQQPSRQQQRPLGVPYLDKNSGQICEEKTVTVEEMEVRHKTNFIDHICVILIR